MMNNSGPRYKRSQLERRLNTDVLWCVFLLIVMCLTAAIGVCTDTKLAHFSSIIFDSASELGVFHTA